MKEKAFLQRPQENRGGSDMNKHGLDQYLRRLTPEEEEHLSGIYMDYSAMPVAGYDRGQPCYRFVYDPQTYISTAAKKTFWWNTIISP